MPDFDAATELEDRIRSDLQARVESGPDSQNLSDGAVWRPDDGWRPIADGPAGMVPGGFAVWDGAEMFVGSTEADSAAPWNTERSEEDARYGIAAYDPIADRWRYIAPLVPDETRQLGPSRQAVLVGGQLLVAVELALPGTAGHGADLVAYDPTTGQSRLVDPGPFAESPYTDASGTVSLTAVGDHVVATPNFDLRPWVLDLSAGTWTRLAAPDTQSLHLSPATASGDRAGFFDSDQLWVLDLSTASWERATSNPGRRARWSFEPVWSGQELFTPGAAYDPDLNRWRTVEPPPRRKNRQRHLTSTWADGLLLFGGEEYTCPDDVTCDRDRTDPDSLDGWLLAP